MDAATVVRFATLYRSACADLALADSYHLPFTTVRYLHRLVGRGHNQLYRSRVFDFAAWGRVLLVQVPARIFHDGCVQLSFCLFWFFFIISAALAWNENLWPQYAGEYFDGGGDQCPGRNVRAADRRSKPHGQSGHGQFLHSSQHGHRLAVLCLWSVGRAGAADHGFQLAVLGASFGYMARPDVAAGANFFNFVTAHGPFELTAIVLSAGAGLRLGISWVSARGASSDPPRCVRRRSKPCR